VLVGGGVKLCSSDGICTEFTVSDIFVFPKSTPACFDSNFAKFLTGSAFALRRSLADCEVIVKWPTPGERDPLSGLIHHFAQLDQVHARVPERHPTRCVSDKLLDDVQVAPPAPIRMATI
jgi:hypothetical protein